MRSISVVSLFMISVTSGIVIAQHPNVQTNYAADPAPRVCMESCLTLLLFSTIKCFDKLRDNPAQLTIVTLCQ